MRRRPGRWRRFWHQIVTADSGSKLYFIKNILKLNGPHISSKDCLCTVGEPSTNGRILCFLATRFGPVWRRDEILTSYIFSSESSDAQLSNFVHFVCTKFNLSLQFMKYTTTRHFRRRVIFAIGGYSGKRITFYKQISLEIDNLVSGQSSESLTFKHMSVHIRRKMRLNSERKHKIGVGKCFGLLPCLPFACVSLRSAAMIHLSLAVFQSSISP